jgi:hypothetical protein
MDRAKSASVPQELSIVTVRHSYPLLAAELLAALRHGKFKSPLGNEPGISAQQKSSGTENRIRRKPECEPRR